MCITRIPKYHWKPKVDTTIYLSLVARNVVVMTHYNDVIMGMIASQITSLTIVYSTVYSDADQRKYQSSASLAFVRGIHRRPVNSLHKWPVTWKMFPFDDVIMGRVGITMTHGFQFYSYWSCIQFQQLSQKQLFYPFQPHLQPLIFWHGVCHMVS